MANTAVSQKLCDLCGAEIRDGSLFCYNCGTAVTKPADTESAKAGDADVPNAAVNANGTAIPSGITRPGSKPAAPRMRPRRTAVAPRDMVWASRDDTSVGFAAIAIVFAIVTLVIILLAYYLR